MSDRDRKPAPKTPPSTIPYALIIQKQPTHVFPEETFQVDFSLTETRKTADSPPQNIDIRATVQGNASLQIIQAPRLSPSKQTGRLVARFTQSTPTGKVTILLEPAGLTKVETQPIQIVTTKLHVTPAPDWQNTWYKDQGGRDKCMEVTVTAQNAAGDLLTSVSHQPLQMQLCYESHVPVMNSDILRLLGRNHMLEDGQCRIRFRIEDVSKNHQGQNFVLKIATPEDPTTAPCWTLPVAIRSKRNKRQRTSMSTAAAAATTTTEPILTRNDDERVREAVQGVLRWSEEVVNGIYPLQWQVMGYAQNPDGTLDYSRPYHNMHNPNAFISRILSMYNDSTRDQLHTLRSAFPSSSPSLYNNHVSSAAAAAAMPPLPMSYPPQQPPPPPLLPPPSSKREYYYEQPSWYRDPYDMKREHPAAAAAATSATTATAAAATPPAYEPRYKHTHDDDDNNNDDNDDEESRVEYVLAKQYKSFSTGEPLGFPAYSLQKDLLGFFRESPMGVRNFCSIQQFPFTVQERQEATSILEDALLQKSRAVHALKDWGSLASMLDNALVYDWSKDIAK